MFMRLIFLGDGVTGDGTPSPRVMPAYAGIPLRIASEDC